MRNETKKRDKYFIIRNILNILFMIVAVVGVLIYIFGDETVGTIVVMFGMLFKVTECSFRMPLLKRDEDE